MVETEGRPGGSSAPDEAVLARLREKLGQAFDLTTPVGAASLGDLVGRRLRGLSPGEPPKWGGAGEITQVASERSRALDFYYRPHLFPGMDPALRLGHLLQFDLLPLTAPGDSPLRIAAVLESYCHLSGDLLGWRMEGDEIFLWIADVSGHGVRAGLAAAVLYFLVEAIEPSMAPGEFCTELHRRMRAARNPHDADALFVTGFWLRVGPEGRASYASSGHPATLWQRGGGELESLPSTGPPIGLLAESEFETVELQLERGDRLCLFTDGVTEAADAAGEEFGPRGLAAVLAARPATPFEAIQEIYQAVGDHRDTSLLDDDLTFMVVERR